MSELAEDWVTVDDSTWNGMRMHALLAMVPEVQRTVAVDFYAAKTSDEVHSQQRHNFPGFVRQMDVMERGGVQHDEMRSDGCGGTTAACNATVSIAT